MSHDDGRPLRRDAAQNAERLLAAAVRAGVARGSQVPMSEIAALAGVGVGTLYRRYPNRAALLKALQLRAYRLLIDVAEHADAEADSGVAAVDLFLRGTFEVRDQLLVPLHGVPWYDEEEPARLSHQVRELVAGMLERGWSDGTIRRDVSDWTVVQFAAMLAHPLPSVAGWEESAAAQRAVFLRGLRPD